MISKRAKSEMVGLVPTSHLEIDNHNGRQNGSPQNYRKRRSAGQICRLIVLRKQTMMKIIKGLFIFATIISVLSYIVSSKRAEERAAKKKKWKHRNIAINGLLLFNLDVIIPETIHTANGDQLMNEAGFSQKPRMKGSFQKITKTYDPNNIQFEHRSIPYSQKELEGQHHLERSDDFAYPDPISKGDCKPQYEWQTWQKPTCSVIHEADLSQFNDLSINSDEDKSAPEKVRYIASGGYRSVWMIRDNTRERTRLALKTLLYRRDYTERNLDRHRRDAMVAERLTSSPRVANIYGYCANTAIFDFAAGGNLESAIEKRYSSWTTSQKLILAHQVSSAIADVHNFDKEGVASVSHTDIAPDQFISVSGKEIYILNDFNRARFLQWNSKEDKACPFYVSSNKGTVRKTIYWLYIEI